ncbi:MAG: DUF2244 domain-containing protein [Magnetovibrio sp.]|nr:DUF2244 domain-containing protein [Magnetovibrio sp.]
MNVTAQPAAPEGVLFQAELRPNRSSTPGAIRVLALALAAVLVPAGLIFVLVGAWPVFGFLGVELIALYALLRYNHRRSYMVERIAVTEADLVVERVDPWGRRREWSFQRPWLQVNLEQSDPRHVRLELRDRGEALTIGAFLTPDERIDVAEKLRRVLAGLCAPRAPEPA